MRQKGEMVVSFTVDDVYEIFWDELPRIKIHNGGADVNDFSSCLIEVSLAEYVSDQNKYDKQYRVPPSVVGAVQQQNTPEWYDESAFCFIKETIEGQQLLEHVLSHFGSRYKLDLPKPKHWADKKFHINETSNIWNKSVEYDKLTVDQIDETLTGSVFDHYVYTLLLVDTETDEEVVYVGESTNIASRIRDHINQGGDFVYPKKNNLVVTDILSIKPHHQVSEKEQYQIMSSEHKDKIVCGGR